MSKNVPNNNKIKLSFGDKVFNVFNYALFGLFALICVFPFYFVIINSISSNTAVTNGDVLFYPIGVHFENFSELFFLKGIGRSFLNSLARVVIGTALSLMCTSFMGYCISRPELFARKFIYRAITITMYLSAGLIPYILTVKNLGFQNNFWVYVIPGLISPYNLMLFKTFVESIPASLEESAAIDGAGYLTRFFRIVLPLCKPILATLCIFSAVGHWNSFMDTVYFVTKEELFTASYRLYQVQSEADQLAREIINGNSTEVDTSQMTASSLRFTIATVVTVPVLLIYPFFQKYFTGGIMIGAVKG